MNRNKIYAVLGIVTLLVITISISYAYFTGNFSGGEEATTISVGGGSLKIVYNGGSNIVVSNIFPQDDAVAVKTFTVTGTNTTDLNMEYYLYLVVDENEFSDNSIRYKLISTNTDGNGNVAPSITEMQNIMQGINETYDLGRGEFIGETSGDKVHTYRLEIYFPNESYSQNDEQGSTIKMHVEISGTEKEISDDYQIVDAANKITIDMNKNMIPITYDANGGTIKSNTTSGSWYNYSTYKWANAVLVTESSRNTHKTSAVGTVIPEADILAYYVWIPRYRYTLWNVNATGGVTATERQITVNFQLSNETVYNGTTNGAELTHPAFWWDKNDNNVREAGEELNGFWVGKFENSADPASECYSEASAANCDTIPLEPRIKPNVPSLRYQKVNTMWTTIEKFKKSSTYGISDSGYDSHMMKNMEWGAVAYLSNSQYGNRANTSSAGNEIYINPSSAFITGRSGNDVSQGQTTDTSGTAASTLYAWNGKVCSSKSGNECTGTIQTLYGPSASTTGTIYGVYDMSGGSYEYVMGNMNASGQDGTRTMQVSSAGTTFGSYNNTTIPKRYYDSYNYGTTYYDAAAFTRGKLGDATKEVLAAISSTGAWNSDYSSVVASSYSWFLRGGDPSDAAISGIWNFNRSTGDNYSNGSGRSLLAMTP